MALLRNELFRREAEDMSKENWQDSNPNEKEKSGMQLEEEELPGLLEEKRRREELSRQIAFGEGL
jgi:hypothetical protein